MIYYYYIIFYLYIIFIFSYSGRLGTSRSYKNLKSSFPHKTNTFSYDKNVKKIIIIYQNNKTLHNKSYLDIISIFSY